MGYFRTLNYKERVSLFNLTHMMSMANHVAIGEEIPRVDSGYSLNKDFIELIHINP